MSKTVVVPITAEATIAVRHTVLRKGKPRETAFFEGDHRSSTVHLGLLLHDEIIGVVTFLEFQADKNTLVWQLRGMAVLDSYQGKGLGVKLVETGEKMACAKGVQKIWCNARIKAKSFYERQGFSAVGNPFEISDIGLHFYMEKKLLCGEKSL